MNIQKIWEQIKNIYEYYVISVGLLSILAAFVFIIYHSLCALISIPYNDLKLLGVIMIGGPIVAVLRVLQDPIFMMIIVVTILLHKNYSISPRREYIEDEYY